MSDEASSVRSGSEPAGSDLAGSDVATPITGQRLVVVTGGTGNLGSAVVDGLLRQGHRVRALARRVPSLVGADERLEWVSLDLTAPDRDLWLRAAFEGADAVVHTAWGFQPTRDAAYLQALDVGGSVAVIEAAVASGVPHVVHTSSVGAYSPGVSDRPVDEAWPTGGTPWLAYSRHKSAVEQAIAARSVSGDIAMAVVRPSLMARSGAGSALARYVLPSLVPADVVGHLPVLPLNRDFRVQLTDSRDVAELVLRILDQGAVGAFNASTDDVLRPADIAEALDARHVPVPWSVVRGAAAAAWTARLQPVDPGWLDMARRVPVLDSTRARSELGWFPRHGAREVLAEVVTGIVSGDAEPTPALRPRTWGEQLRHLVSSGPVSRRRRA
ncbi:nucleoside-diphosphate-sugar epimerase [Knoellia remsis]|uniref:Nucleoside-diphosphate-sugar epimerase n=1 Tax=Knoellia remsis TaxID=407159 RepID=A0A2T0U9U4_9MICO|nr:NAD-dependent epimerase/dehydratase family protein [Knoellia remsis]PRY54690.1 nucleoside-diphosphate-sugar epimerase [Knoellia remsis]